MRKQYHFWPGENGFDAWDVDRLIAVSASFQVKEINLDAIWEIDNVYWFDGQQEAKIRRVIEHICPIRNVDLSYPIILE